MNNRQIFLNFYLTYKKNYYNKNVMAIFSDDSARLYNCNSACFILIQRYVS